MKNGLKKGLSIALLLLLIIVSAGIAEWRLHGLPLHRVRATPAVVAPVTPAPAVQDKIPAANETNTLNLALPQPPMLMDPKIELPGRPQDIQKLFTQEAPEPAVKVGGHLILKETPPVPNAAVWDQVKGAEVGITIKTP